MSAPTTTPHSAVATLHRLDNALEDMRDELPHQMLLVAQAGAAQPGQAVEVFRTLEKQLRWLADDVARAAQGLPAQGEEHEHTR